MRGIAVLWLSVGCSWIPPEEEREEEERDPPEVSVDEEPDDGIPEGDGCDAGGPEVPSDGIDNDCDGAIDCDDPDLVHGVLEGDQSSWGLQTFCVDYDCAAITGSLSIEESDLKDLEELSCITSVDGWLVIYANNKLSTLHGLESLTSVGALFLSGNDSLTNLRSLDRFARIERGPLVIRDNDRLTTLTGLEGIESIGGGYLVIEENDRLATLTALENLETVGAIDISSNGDLTTLAGLERVTELLALDLRSNARLVDVEALHGLRTVQDDVTITDNVALGSAAVWDLIEEIDTIGGDMFTAGNQ